MALRLGEAHIFYSGRLCRTISYVLCFSPPLASIIDVPGGPYCITPLGRVSFRGPHLVRVLWSIPLARIIQSCGTDS
jgi:hypothetical protein